MAGTLKVDIAGLLGASSEVADRAAALASAHTNSLSSLASAETGWVGSSADALVGMAEKWQTISDRHTAAVESHATHLDTAARLFDDMEQRNAAELKGVAGPSDL
ncbi:WXG100 family type VII secretion target [Mycolicibacterium sp. CBM1]